MEPKELMAVWMTTEPIAVIEYLESHRHTHFAENVNVSAADARFLTVHMQDFKIFSSYRSGREYRILPER